MQITTPKTKLRMTLNCSIIAKEIAMMSGIFNSLRARGRHCFIPGRGKNKKDYRKLRRKLVNRCPKQCEQGDHKRRTLKHRNKQRGPARGGGGGHMSPV